MKVGNGQKTLLRKDIRVGQCTLETKFPLLANIISNKKATVKDGAVGWKGEWPNKLIFQKIAI